MRPQGQGRSRYLRGQLGPAACRRAEGLPRRVVDGRLVVLVLSYLGGAFYSAFCMDQLTPVGDDHRLVFVVT
jgi:hypothetical protein